MDELRSASSGTIMSDREQELFWRLYAERVQPGVERACRAASRKLTDNGMNPDDMAAWVDDRVWKLLARGRWPFFHDSPTAEEAVARVEEGIGTLARWAYLALSRKHWRRTAAEARWFNGLTRVERLSLVSSSSQELERREEVMDAIEQIRARVGSRVRARMAASWPDRSEARRVAAVLAASSEEDEALLARVESGEIAANTVDQMRSRSRREIRAAVGGNVRRAVLLALFTLLLLGVGARPAAAGEQSGGRGGGADAGSEPQQTAPAVMTIARGEQSGGRGGRG